MRKNHRKFLENIYCQNEGQILMNMIEEDIAINLYREGILPVKKLSDRHLIKSINERYPQNCPNCEEQTKIKLLKNNIQCSNCNYHISEGKPQFLLVEYDPKGMPDMCNTFSTEYAYIPCSILDKLQWNVEKAFSEFTKLPSSYIYAYCLDDRYIKDGNDYITYDED